MEPVILYDSTREENPAINLYEHDNKTCGSIQNRHAIQIIGTYTGEIQIEYSLDNEHWGPYGELNVGENINEPNTVFGFPCIPAWIRVNVTNASITSLKVLLI